MLYKLSVNKAYNFDFLEGRNKLISKKNKKKINQKKF